MHPDAKANRTVDLNEGVLRRLGETIAAFRAAGVTDSEIRIAFGKVMNQRA